MSELPALVGGKYRPLRLIGQGGMGIVYEVVHENTGEHLALKLLVARSRLEPELVERFRREARATTSVKSDHVVRVTDADVAPELDGAPFLVMELLEGQNFEELCLERQPSPDECVDWLRQVGRALDKAHQQRIVHRDLKPANLFLAERVELPPIVKVLDFGIAKMVGDGGSGTGSGQILGTPRYMAPEQVGQGTGEISAASDRYALGLVAFRLLSGRHYFDDGDLMKLLVEVGRGATRAPSALGCSKGPLFDAWFARACAVDAAQRFYSCFEQIEAFAEALGLVTLSSAAGKSPRRSASTHGSVPPTASSDALELAPTLQASIVTGRTNGVAAPRSTALWGIGVVGASAIAVFLGLRWAEPNAADGSSAAKISSSLPAGSVVPAQPLPAIVVPPAQTAEAPQTASADPMQPAGVSSAPAPGTRRPPALVASVRARPPAAKPKPKNSIWDEP
jgi:eukaryotic-like serine/threonine-protein kinase